MSPASSTTGSDSGPSSLSAPRGGGEAAGAGAGEDGAEGGEREESVLSPLEVEVIDLFVSAVRLAGIPKSIGEIYGLLFISSEPLPLDALVRRLRISKGSASQGLRFLRTIGAVKPVYVAGERRDHFEAVLELKQLAAGFIREGLQPHLDNGTRRIERLTALAAEETGPGADPERADLIDQRMLKLRLWHERAVEALPLIKGMLGR